MLLMLLLLSLDIIGEGSSGYISGVGREDYIEGCGVGVGVAAAAGAAAAAA